MDPTKQELWAERVRSFGASGLSRRAWCERQGLPKHQLDYWIRKSRKRAQPAGTRWVALDANSIGTTGVSVVIGRVTLTVQHGFDQKVLAEVVRTLVSVC